nr:epididymal secretory protein 4-like [Anolis sagrei ordinatus]
MGLGLGPLLSFVFFLGGLPLLCPSAEDVPVMQNLDIKKLVGKWYPIVSAKSEAMPRPFHAFTLEAKDDGSAVLKVEIPRFGSCRIKKYPLETESPGVFNMEGNTTGDATGVQQKDKSSIRVLDTDYNSYLISEFLSGSTIFLCLYATEKEVQANVLKKFVTLVEKMNMDPERLFFRHEIDLCSIKKRKEESK